MFLIKLVRFLFGVVSFEAKGGFPGRFINLCHLDKIPLWNMSVTGEKVSAQTSVKGYKRIRRAAKKSAVSLRVTEKNGLPFTVRNNRIRVAFFICAVICVVFYAFAAGRIWRIEVTGNELLSGNIIVDTAEKLGLTRGMSKRDFSAENIEISLKNELPTISWVAANLKGCTLELSVREDKDKPEIKKKDGSYNVVAARDGYIKELNIMRGTKSAELNTAVSKGDVIFSGIVTRKDGSFYAVHAEGQCFAETERRLSVSALPEKYQAVSVSGERKKIYFFGIEIPIGLKNDSDTVSRSERDIGGSDYTLPIGIIKESYFDLAEAPEFADKTENLLLSLADFYDAYRDLREKAEIIDEKIEYGEDKGEVIYSARCYEDIAEEKSFEVDFNYKPKIE